MKTYWLTSKRNAGRKTGAAPTDNPQIPVIQEPKGDGKPGELTSDVQQQSLIAEKKKNIAKRITKDATLSTNGISPDIGAEKVKDGGGGRAPSGEAKKDSLGKPAKICLVM